MPNEDGNRQQHPQHSGCESTCESDSRCSCPSGGPVAAVRQRDDQLGGDERSVGHDKRIEKLSVLPRHVELPSEPVPHTTLIASRHAPQYELTDAIRNTSESPPAAAARQEAHAAAERRASSKLRERREGGSAHRARHVWEGPCTLHSRSCNMHMQSLRRPVLGTAAGLRGRSRGRRRGGGRQRQLRGERGGGGGTGGEGIGGGTLTWRPRAALGKRCTATTQAGRAHQARRAQRSRPGR